MDKEKDKPIKCNGCKQMMWCWEDGWSNGAMPWCRNKHIRN